jgi:glycosyltransferase involved in cell wall biosynthesis
VSPVAFVVPIFKHSQLFADAVASVLAARERAGSEAPIVLVDDGCPFLSTHLGGMSLRESVPGLFYVRGPNQGLSGARNRGIDFVLEKLPATQAIYFLDADNLIAPYGLQSMLAALARYPDVDWFYPNMNMFGLELRGDCGGEYLPLVEAFANICEAGSLVRTRMLRAGIRFDESMRSGFEDWDFWLSATEAGFVGRHCPELGLRYRKRPESMLADSEREREDLVNYLRTKHRWIRDPHSLLGLEHDRLPRYAIYLADTGKIVLTSDPRRQAKVLGLEEFKKLFFAAAIERNKFHAGRFVVATTSAALRAINELGMAPWVFLDLELRLQECGVSAVALASEPGTRLGAAEKIPGTGPVAHLAMIGTPLLRSGVNDDNDGWIRSLIGERPSMKIQTRRVRVPREVGLDPGPSEAINHLMLLGAQLRASKWKGTGVSPGSGVTLVSPDRASVYDALCRNLRIKGLMPAMRDKPIEVAFVVPILDFGGVERVACAVARALRARGVGCHLFVLGCGPISFTADVRGSFDSLSFMDLPGFLQWSGPRYIATPILKWSLDGDHGAAIGHLAAFDAVIACHASDLFGVFGRLQRMRVVTGSYVHINDLSPTGLALGHPELTVAFEHALDLVIGCSSKIAAEMIGRGVPADKVVVVPNSTGIPEQELRDVDWVAMRRARALERERSRRTNVLFMGRLDRQKGVDRLGRVIERESWADTGVKFRVVGRSILEGAEIEMVGQVRIEPPAYDAATLIELLGWADVLLLPSRYEGLPLGVIEALTAGVVPIVAECGAVREVVEDGANGFVVSQQRCVAEMSARLLELAQNPARTLTMAEAAIASMGTRHWHSATEELHARLCSAVAARRKSYPSVGARLHATAEAAEQAK